MEMPTVITNLPAIHSVVFSVCVKYLPVYTVPMDVRFLVRRIGPKNFHIFCCVARYGYKDLHKKDDNFEKMRFGALSLFVRLESLMDGYWILNTVVTAYRVQRQKTDNSVELLVTENGNSHIRRSTLSDSIEPVQSPHHANGASRFSGQMSQTEAEEFLNRCKQAGVVHIHGNTILRARRK